MNGDLNSLLDFYRSQMKKQASHFPTVKYDKVLTFMGTTSVAGTYAAVSALPIVRLEPGVNPSEMRVHLRGPLPRALARNECVSVHITRVEQYQGFQIKTKPLSGPETEDQLVHQSGGALVVEGRQIYTVHHSPYTMKFFEQIPFEEVQQIVGVAKYALVGVGETANISPRFVFHMETKLERPVFYHGDGLALKTYMNLKQNRQETRMLLDLTNFEGYSLRGTVEEFAPHQHPEAYDRICQGFAAGNWGRPSRVFRFVAEQWTPVKPAA